MSIFLYILFAVVSIVGIAFISWSNHGEKHILFRHEDYILSVCFSISVITLTAMFIYCEIVNSSIKPQYYVSYDIEGKLIISDTLTSEDGYAGTDKIDEELKEWFNIEWR